jgi:UDP-N-acetylmuramoylalanine--D-glutamate ligase
MKNFKEYFKGKRITMLGLGLLGRGLNDAKFLAECGADLTVTDLKTEDDLKPTLKKLAKFKNVKYVLGGHQFEDFRDKDFILKSAGVPLHSVYIEEAQKNNIPVKMDASWFAELVPEVKIVGVTGTRGKSTTTHLIYQILKAAEGKEIKGKIYLGGNVKGLATLPYLKKIKANDIVVMELDSWQLQGFGEAGISPNISVFTNLLSDHLNYYLKGSVDEAEATQRYFMDKAQIFVNQKEGDYLILDKDIKKIIEVRYKEKIKSKIVLIKNNSEIKDWKFKIKGEHNMGHILRAIEAAKLLGVEIKTIKKVVEGFTGVPGRQEFIREYKGIKIYNDTTATTPDATIMALRAFGNKDSFVRPGKVLTSSAYIPLLG